jgi:DNA polymerase III delta prime subunit
MSTVDYLGARASNAGDYFHQLWALRHALSLLDHALGLTVLTVEGVRPEDEAAGQSQRSWDGVDCGLYYGAATIKDCSRVEIEQLKYSSAAPGQAWTIARLTNNTAKKGNNSVMRRLADAFLAVESARGQSEGIAIRLVSNQPIAADVTGVLEAILAGESPTQPPDRVETLNQLVDAVGLSGESLRKFVESLDLSQTGSRFALEEEILKTIAAWTDDDATVILNTLVQFIARKMLPESKGEFITREDVFIQFGFSSERALFPCPSEILSVATPVQREATATVVREMHNGKQFICLHGPAGCGKTTALQEVESELPQDSVMIVFDCYGAGRYLDSDAYRHRPKDAFLQLSNDIATRLRVPLLLTRSNDTDYPRSFKTRLDRAAEILTSSSKTGLLVLAIDAADNSVTAASHVTPPERTFVHDFVNFGSLPENVRFLVTARTGRVEQLKLSPRFHQVQIEGFTPDETRTNAHRAWNNIPEGWVDDFHHLSGGNPRVQSYALEYGRGDLTATLNYLRPGGKDLKQVFDQRLGEAMLKGGGSTAVDSFCAALVILPRPIPWAELAAISNLTIAQVRDICGDLSPAIRTIGDNMGFADEDFEHFVRERVVNLDETRARVAERFLARHEADAYAATHLVPALHQAGRGKEIIRLLETHPAPAVIQDPLIRREVQLQRIRTAVQSANEQEDAAGALRTIMVGAEALKTDSSIREMVTENPDLAAAFMIESASKMVLQDAKEVEHHGPLLFHRLRQNALAKNGVMAREDYRQLRAWLDRRGEDLARKKAEHPSWRHPDAWSIGTRDVAAEVEATMLLFGAEAGVADLGHWKPRELHLGVAQFLVPHLLTSGHADLVETCVDKNLVSPPWDLALLVPLAISGRTVNVARFDNSIRHLHRFMRIFQLHRLRNEWSAGLASFWFDTIVTACEIVIAHGGARETIVPVLATLADPQFRRIDQLHITQSSLLDVLFRAHALLEEVSGRGISVDSFVIKSDSTDGGDNRNARRAKHDVQERDEEVRRTIGSLVSIYRVRAEIVSGKVNAEGADKPLASATATFLHDSWQFARQLGARDLRRRAALSVANLMFVPKLDPMVVLERSLGIFKDHLDPFGSDETAVLSVLALNSSCHQKAHSLITKRAESVSVIRTAARERIDAMLKLARFMDPISRSDAKAIFGRAHSMTEELDSEAIFLLKSLAALSARAKAAMSDSACRDNAGGFATVLTDAAIRLSGQDGFPWFTAVTGLATLNLPVALSAISQWEDTRVGDWELCLEAAFEAALSERTMTPEEVAALLPLTEDPPLNLFSLVVGGLDVTDVQRSRVVLETLARDELLRFGKGRRKDVCQILRGGRAGAAGIGPWFERLENTCQFVSAFKAENHEGASGHEIERMRPEVIRQVVLGMQGQYVTAGGIAATLRAVNEAAGTGIYASTQQVFEEIRATIGLNERIPHLQALVELAGSGASENEVAQAINAGIADWESPGVQEWSRDNLPGFLLRHLPNLVAWLALEREAPIRSLVALLSRQNVNIPQILIKGIALRVDELRAESVYTVVSLIAEYLEKDEAASVLQEYLPRCVRRIPEKDQGQLSVADIPSGSTEAVGRFLFALLSDCDVRIRWRAAHVLRRLAQFRQTQLLHSVIDLYDRMVEPSFRAPETPFYWIAARLWTMIALDRIAEENPEMLVAYGARLLQIARDDTFPHVLIRGFARDTVEKLLRHGGLHLTAQQQNGLDRVNRGKGAKKRVVERHTDGPRHSEQGRFHFDIIDTLPYWYDPAARIFAEVTTDELSRVAEEWIVDRWGVTPKIERWNSEPRPQRFPENSWGLWSNNHGSRPTLERYFTYLEWHGMWCAVGTLLQSEPLALVDPEEYGSFENWLRGERLTRPPLWLADLRAPKPLELQLWSAPQLGDWLTIVEDPEFLGEIGVGANGSERIVIDAHHTTYASDFRSEVTVRSALIQPETAGALVRALQTAEEPIRYWIPYERERDGGQFDEPPYRLLGWIGISEGYAGLDESDPDRNQVNGNQLEPGREARKSLRKRVSSAGVIEWFDDPNAVEYSYRQWSDSSDDDERSYSRVIKSNGSRFDVSIDRLRTHLVRLGLDLLVKIEVERSKGERYAGIREEKGTEARFDRIVVLRRDGTIEGAEGPLGTWYAPRP